MAIRLPSYLHRNRHGVFGFRVVVPRDLRVSFSAAEYRVSLKTSDKRQAKALSVSLVSFTVTHFQTVRRMRKDAPNATPIDFLQQLDAERQRIALDALEDAGVTTGADLRETVAATVEALPQGLLRELGLGLLRLYEHEIGLEARQRALIAKALESFSAESGENADDESDDALFCDLYAEAGELKIAEAALRSEVDQHRALIRELHAEQSRETALTAANADFARERDQLAAFASQIIAKTAQNSPGAVSASPSPQGDQQKAETALSAVLAAYCENQKAEGSWTEKTALENQGIFDLWLRIVGDQPTSGYGFDQHRVYKATLLKLPANLNKSPRYRGKSINAIIALRDPPAAPNTINKALTRVAALFKWAVGYGYATFNPAGAMNIKNPKRASEERKAFTEDDLKKLFLSPDYIEGKHAAPYMHWAPLIALYTGARINEIAQLHLADFQERGGIPVISINDEGEGKRLKTKAGKREIPIHPELIRLGLLERVDVLRKEKAIRLFPELKTHRDGYGQTVSRWFARYRKQRGITEEGKVFHSFRHTVVDRLKQAGIAKEKIAALVGHEDESMTFGRYGKAFNAAAMMEVVSCLDFSRITTALRND